MYEILEKINCPNDVKKLNDRELALLADEIRNFLVDSVSKTGGHLASNLGVVELTLALFKVFDLPKDKIVWDVGHQTYVHKLLTGRRERFDTLRQFGGLSGFPKCEESEYDSFNTGHSSTSVSAALGLAEARNLNNDDSFITAVIGDGALTGGMAFEALNDAGPMKKNFIVILNDNNMSISKNVGGISKYLTKIRSKPVYFKFKALLERFFRRLPVIGEPLFKISKRLKDSFRHLLTSSTIFEDLGFTYLGPIDGHDIELLSYVLESAKSINNPVLLHILTKKGKGYKFAEEAPVLFHGISRFTVDTGKAQKNAKTEDYSSAFGRHLLSLADKTPKLCAITAAMPVGTGLVSFAEKYPDRFFDAGIAEQHAVTFAAGLAKGGFTPVFAVYSSFLQRAYDQILHDVCLQNLHIVFCIDRAGIVGEDGETHQGVYDLSFLSAMPNMTILAPSNLDELGEMLDYAVLKHNGPIAIRYPRGNSECIYENKAPFTYGKPDLVTKGKDVCILAVGNMLAKAASACELLKEQNIRATVFNMRTVFPLDKDFITESAKEYPLLVTLEDGIRRGGFGESIASLLTDSELNTKLLIKAHENPVVPHGNPEILYKHCGLDEKTIAQDIIKKLRG